MNLAAFKSGEMSQSDYCTQCCVLFEGGARIYTTLILLVFHVVFDSGGGSLCLGKDNDKKQRKSITDRDAPRPRLPRDIMESFKSILGLNA